MGALMKALFEQSCCSSAEGFGAQDTTTPEMRAAIQDWFALYFRREADETEDPCQRIPYTIVNKLYKAVFGEYDSAIVDADKHEKLLWLDANRAQLDRVKQEAMQWALVGGECYLKPNLQNGRFSFVVLRRDRYAVLARGADGAATALGAVETTQHSKKHYTLLEKRSIGADGLLTVENKLFESTTKDTPGRKVPLQTLECYAGLPERYTFPVPLGLGLVRVKTPMANCVDGTADGVSVYEPAVQLIHNINKNEKQLDDEFELGRMRMTVPDDMLVEFGTRGKRSIRDKIFVGLFDGRQERHITVFAPALRDESFERRKQGYLRACESMMGIKRGMLSNVEAVERTKKEITSSEGDYNLTVIDFQRMWFDAVRETLRLCEALGQLYGLCSDYPFDVTTALSISWGNGVLYDPDTEWAETLKLVQYGMLKPEIALAWKYDLPWDTPQALAAIRETYLPELAALAREV